MSKDFFARYKHKIKSVSELCSIIGTLPRKETAIYCHGVFDVVHPGHIRHLTYAKSKADILIVSITADKHIKKGIYRPHIPQDIRALNLAAFEMVDYVIIDKNEKPLKNLNKIRPNRHKYISEAKLFGFNLLNKAQTNPKILANV